MARWIINSDLAADMLVAIACTAIILAFVIAPEYGADIPFAMTSVWLRAGAGMFLLVGMAMILHGKYAKSGEPRNWHEALDGVLLKVEDYIISPDLLKLDDVLSSVNMVKDEHIEEMTKQGHLTSASICLIKFVRGRDKHMFFEYVLHVLEHYIHDTRQSIKRELIAPAFSLIIIAVIGTGITMAMGQVPYILLMFIPISAWSTYSDGRKNRKQLKRLIAARTATEGYRMSDSEKQ